VIIEYSAMNAGVKVQLHLFIRSVISINTGKGSSVHTFFIDYRYRTYSTILKHAV